MIDDLTMLANLPVVDVEATEKAKAEAARAAASETTPVPKQKTGSPGVEHPSARLARRGQDAPTPQPADDEDRG